MVSLLLDEMLSVAIASQLRSLGHDVIAAVEDRSMLAAADKEIFERALTAGRALVTANIKDFVPLDYHYKAEGRSHCGLILVSSKSFPQDRAFTGAVVTVLDKLLNDDRFGKDSTVFLQRQ